MILLLLMLINGLVSAGFSAFLYNIYKRNQKRFYLTWAVGFLFYGLNIIIRGLTNATTYSTPSPLTWLAFACYMGGYTAFLVGNGQLLGQTGFWLIASAGMVAIPIAVYIFSGPAVVGWAVTLAPFLLMTVSLLFIRRRYPVTVDLLVIGWLFLFLVNLSIPMGLIDAMYVEVLAIFAKLIIFVGMVSPKFSLLEDDVRKFLLSGMTTEYPLKRGGEVTIIDAKGKSREEEVRWIEEKVASNEAKGVKTILISFYNLVSLESTGAAYIGKNLHVVTMMPGGSREAAVFDGRNTTINDDSGQLCLFLTDVITYSKETNAPCDVILYTLSWVIHSNGWKKVYSNFLGIIGDLKTSNVNLYCFVYPETHGDKVEVAVFEKMVDKVISI